MNALQTFLATLPCGFLNGQPQMNQLKALDRLLPVLVRCGGGRFTCAAQDFEHFMACVIAGGDYVRDVSAPVGSSERAATWVRECPVTPAASLPESFLAPRPVNHSPHPRFNENDCGGVFDGCGVVSDADSGL